MASASTPGIEPTAASLAGRVIGGCRLESLLGVGGMGAVWRAHHLALDIPVALKLMLPIEDVDPNASERLLREARAAARLRHPHIVGVLNVGKEEGLHFLVMELVEGESLQKLLDRRGALPAHEAVTLMLQILEALELTFAHRFVHRDIKPDNILIDRHGVAKLADLGLAKRAEGDLDLTQTGVVMGSPYYIAPEQAANAKAVDPRADLYALGCVLFHLLTGAPPFGGSTHLEVILKHIREPVPGLSQCEPRLPPGLEAAVLRLLAKLPDDRFQSPQDARAALAPFAAAADNAAPERAPSPSGRRLALFAGAVAATAISIVLVAVMLPRSREHAPPAPRAAIAPATIAPAAKPVPPARIEKRDERQRPRRRNDTGRPRVSPHGPSTPATVEPAPMPSRNPLMQALAAHDTQQLRRLLDRGTPPNVRDGDTSPLHRAVAMGQPQYVRMLLEKGANPNARDQAGETPLHHALQHGDRSSVSVLLDFGANPNLRDRSHRTPLDLAGGDPFLLQKLREKGANP